MLVRTILTVKDHFPQTTVNDFSIFRPHIQTAEEKYNEYFNPYNMKIIMESLEELNAGKGIVMTMEELEAMENE